MFKQGVIPNNMVKSVIHPTVKSSSKSIHDIGNYRPFIVIPVITRILEDCAIRMIESKLSFHDSQFGSMKNGGCSSVCC